MSKAMRVTGSLARVMAAIDEIASDPKFQEFQAEMEAAPNAPTPTASPYTLTAGVLDKADTLISTKATRPRGRHR